jgi:hypothetical protein
LAKTYRDNDPKVELKEMFWSGLVSYIKELVPRLEVSIAMNIQVVIWIVTPFSDVVGYQHFGGPCCFLHHTTSSATRIKELDGFILSR